jgi:hypothetical protein
MPGRGDCGGAGDRDGGTRVACALPPMPLLRRRRCLAFLAPLLPCALVVASACDPFPDECASDDNVCDGNVANVCDQPGPESRLVTEREDCGSTRMCVVRADGSSVSGTPVCARAGAECGAEGERSCRDETTVSVCIRTTDGRLVFLDRPCLGDLVCGADGSCKRP